MPVLNCVIAHNLDKLADPIERGGGNPFRMRAYRSAARIVGDLPPSVTGMTAPGEDLAERPGIREDLAERIETLAATGHVGVLDETGRKTLLRGAPPLQPGARVSVGADAW
jgi:DNA polymerase (family X)